MCRCSQSGLSPMCSKVNRSMRSLNCWYRDREWKVTAICQSGCCVCRYAALSASTTVFPEPASPRMRCGPSGVSIAADFCQRSRLAISRSIALSTEPREPSFATFWRFFTGLMVVTRWIAADRLRYNPASSSGFMAAKAATNVDGDAVG